MKISNVTLESAEEALPWLRVESGNSFCPTYECWLLEGSSGATFETPSEVGEQQMALELVTALHAISRSFRKQADEIDAFTGFDSGDDGEIAFLLNAGAMQGHWGRQFGCAGAILAALAERGYAIVKVGEAPEQDMGADRSC